MLHTGLNLLRLNPRLHPCFAWGGGVWCLRCVDQYATYRRTGRVREVRLDIYWQVDTALEPLRLNTRA